MPTGTTPLPWADSATTDPGEPPPTVRTPRLELRRMTIGDAPALAALWNDPEVAKYLPPMRRPVGDDRARLAIAQYDAHWARHGYGTWAVDELASGAFVGYCGLRYVRELGAAEDITVLVRSAWGKGYATEAAGAAQRFGFERAGLGRIIGLIEPDNAAARRAAEKVGRRLECELRLHGATWLLYAVARADASGEGPAPADSFAR